MKLKTLKPRIATVGSRLATLSTNPNATPRQRGRGWMDRRERLLSAKPWCAMCIRKAGIHASDLEDVMRKCEEQGIAFPFAAEVDHVVPLHKGGPDTDENTQNLCVPCHLEKTKTDVSQWERYRME